MYFAYYDSMKEINFIFWTVNFFSNGIAIKGEYSAQTMH